MLLQTKYFVLNYIIISAKSNVSFLLLFVTFCIFDILLFQVYIHTGQGEIYAEKVDQCSNNRYCDISIATQSSSFNINVI